MDSSQTFKTPNQQIDQAGQIYQIAQSLNGKFLAVGIGQYSIYFYSTSNLEKPLKILDGCTGTILGKTYIQPKFSHNSKMFVFRWNNFIRILNTETLEVRNIDNGMRMETFSFSPDDRYLAVGHYLWTDCVMIYDLQQDYSSNCLGTFTARCVSYRQSKFFVKINPVWSPISNQIVSQWNGNIIGFEISSKGITKICELPHYNYIWDMSFSPNGKYLAVATSYGVTIWDWEAKTIKGYAKGFSNPGNLSCWNNPNTAFSHDSEYFAVAEYKNCNIYKTSDLSLVNTIKLESTIHTIQFSPKSTYLGLGYYSGYYVLDLNRQKGHHIQLCTSSYFQKINPIWNNEESTLLGKWGSSIYVWHLKDIEEDSESDFEITQSKIYDPLLDTQETFELEI